MRHGGRCVRRGLHGHSRHTGRAREECHGNQDAPNHRCAFSVVVMREDVLPSELLRTAETGWGLIPTLTWPADSCTGSWAICWPMAFHGDTACTVAAAVAFALAAVPFTADTTGVAAFAGCGAGVVAAVAALLTLALAGTVTTDEPGAAAP